MVDRKFAEPKLKRPNNSCLRIRMNCTHIRKRETTKWRMEIVYEFP